MFLCPLKQRYAQNIKLLISKHTSHASQFVFSREYVTLHLPTSWIVFGRVYFPQQFSTYILTRGGIFSHSFLHYKFRVGVWVKTIKTNGFGIIN